MPKPIALLTNPIQPGAMPELHRHCEVVIAPDTSAETLLRLVADAEALIVRAALPPTIFEGAPKLRAVVRHGVGLDMIPVEAATAHGIPVANLPGSNTQAVAEYCIAAMLHLRRGVAMLDGSLRANGWSSSRRMAGGGLELGGSVLGIVGVGAIGLRVAQLAQAFGMRVLALTRRPETLPRDVHAVDKLTLFGESDAVVLCCPLTEQTRRMVDAPTLALMKPHALLVNVARGAVVDTTALVEALSSRRIGGAALDVHEHQPLEGSESVFAAPNVLLTPHIAGSTETSLRLMSETAIRTVFALLRGEQPPNVVNPEVFLVRKG